MANPKAKPMTDAERRWWRRLCRVLADQPPETWLYVANGDLTLMRKAADGAHLITPTGGVDVDFMLAINASADMDGGDW